MAISPINIARVSQNLRTSFVIESVRRNQLELFRVQTRIASGRSFVSPSEDPPAAARVLDLSFALGRNNQFSANLRYADNVLAASDSAITEISTLVTEAQTIASQDVGNLTSAAERAADAELIAGIRRQLQIVGNRQFGGRFLFAGRETTTPPFVDASGGIAYIGDTGDLSTRVGDGLAETFNVTGDLLFGALSSRIAGDRDLSPLLTSSTRLDDLNGALGRGVPPAAGVRLGTLIFNEVGGVGVFTVDLRSADTIGDIVDLINESAVSAGSTLTASLSEIGLLVTPGSQAVTIADTSADVIASDLGILTTSATSDVIEGQDLGARLTMLTPIAALSGGAGVDLEGGLMIRNGSQTEVSSAASPVDLSQARTVQDLINVINNAGMFVMARINDEGTGLDLVNQVSGTVLTVAENEGTTASDLGLRTLDVTTSLARLNFGGGVTTVEGMDDLRVIGKDGATVDVNLDGAMTVGEVVDLINEAAGEAGVAIAASLAESGNGIRIADNTGGTGDLSVTTLNLSSAAIDLGLAKSVSGEAVELLGDDPSGVRTEGILSALADLESALRRDDTQAISQAAERMNTFFRDVTRIHGVVGARSQAMQAKLRQMQDAAQTTEIFLSQVQDLDFTTAVTQLQRAQTQLQVNLQTSSVLLSLSLLDFLR